MNNSDLVFNIVLKEAALFQVQLHVPETLDGLAFFFLKVHTQNKRANSGYIKKY
jgi:hypothetical protein